MNNEQEKKENACFVESNWPLVYAPPVASSGPPRVVQMHTNEPTHPAHTRKEATQLGSESRPKLPEFEIGLMLIEVFFSRVWTASLLFDHRSFVEDYRAANLPDHVLLSVFALSSLFFRAPLPGSCTKENGLAALAPIHDLGRGWAESGSQLVLMHADRPSIANIQACEVLCFYWFAVGELDRNAMHFSISRESCRLLQQKAARKEIRGGVLASDYFKVPQRLSWACSIKRSVMETDMPLETTTMSCSELPSASVDEPEVDFTSGSSTPQIPQKGAVDWLNWDERGRRSATAYVVRIFAFWKEIKTFVQRSSYTNASAFLAAFFDLDSKLQQFYKSLPHEFRANDLMTHTSSERLQRNAYFVRSVYYLCVMYLHSAAVPALSGIKNGLCPSPEIIKLSARKVFSTAREFVELSKEYFSTTPDFTKVPSFVGFCAFVAGSVQEAVMDFQITGEDYDFSGDVAICMVVLKELMVYWPVLKCFESDLERRLERSNPHFSSFSKTTVEKLLRSPRPLVNDEQSPPALEAFINASSSIPSKSEGSFILRQYNNPNAFRHSKDLNDVTNAMEEDDHDDISPNNHIHDADPATTSPSTEELPRNEDSHQANLVNTTKDHTLSPFVNTVDNSTAPGLLSGHFMGTDAPSANLWGFGDLFSDNWEELLPDLSSDQFG